MMSFMGDMRNAHSFLLEKLEVKKWLGICRRRWRIILKWILKKQYIMMRTRFTE
jgi:hypothetical protein